MEATRAEILAIQGRLKGEIASIQDRLEGADEETEALLTLEFDAKTNLAVWEALHTLAAHIDYLRAATVTGPWVEKGKENPPRNYPGSAE